MDGVSFLNNFVAINQEHFKKTTENSTLTDKIRPNNFSQSYLKL